MNKNILIGAIIVVVLIIGGVYYYQSKNGAQNLYPVDSVTPTETSLTPKISSPGQPGSPVSQKTYSISVVNFAFNPAVLTVSQGDTVTWINQDSAPHQIWGNDFKSEVLSNGQSFGFTFTKVGTFDYICSLHAYMKGQIIVK